MKINQTGENKGFAFLTFDSTEGWGYNFLFRNYTKISREISPISGEISSISGEISTIPAQK